MPIPPTWLMRLTEIRATVQGMPEKELDREQIIGLFRVRRRAALLLMKRLEPRMVRGSWRIERSRLEAWLEGQMSDAERELERRGRMTRALISADCSLPRLPRAFLCVEATQEMRSNAAKGLPDGVSLAIGRASRREVNFQTLEELAEKLLEVGLALDRNFDHYAGLLASTSASKGQSQKDLERADAEFFSNWTASGT